MEEEDKLRQDIERAERRLRGMCAECGRTTHDDPNSSNHATYCKRGWEVMAEQMRQLAFQLGIDLPDD